MKIVQLLFIVLAFTACKKNNETKDSYDAEKIIYKITPYESVINNSTINIEITDEVPRDEIHFIGTAKQIESITREVVDGVLTIDTKDYNYFYKKDEQITVRINNNHIKSFTIKGVGFIKSSLNQTATEINTNIIGAGTLALNIDNKKIKNTITGVGNVTLTGKTSWLETSISGTGNLNAFDLETTRSTNNISGIGNAHINVTKILEAKISGIGNVTYKGNPTDIITEVTGLGNVKAN